MNNIVLKLSLIWFCHAGCLAWGADDLNGSSGRIYRVNLEEKSIEFLTRTDYAPKGEEGKSRHTVYWDDETRFVEVTPLSDFGGLEGAFVGQFYYLEPGQVEAARQGTPFSCRSVDVYDSSMEVTGLRKDGRFLTALFVPDGKLTAEVEWEGKKIPFRGSRKRFSLKKIQPASEQLLGKGHFEARIFGKLEGDRFVLSRARLTNLPDPRNSDDPNLPRILVIGDSISMNYDKAARAALAGKVNYHRIANNGGPSSRGVESMDLWLGNHQEQGLHWDVIQFNHGLHDLKRDRHKDGAWGAPAVSLEEYKKNLETEIALMKKTGATLIWCATTPVPNDSGDQKEKGRRKDDDLIYNRTALKVISGHPEILITDLNKAVRQSAVFDEWRKGVNVHFKGSEELSVLGETVAKTIVQAAK